MTDRTLAGLVAAEAWGEFLAGADGAADEELRLATRTGRPLGTDSFVSQLEARLGRRLRAYRVGRPKQRKGDGR